MSDFGHITQLSLLTSTHLLVKLSDLSGVLEYLSSQSQDIESWELYIHQNDEAVRTAQFSEVQSFIRDVDAPQDVIQDNIKQVIDSSLADESKFSVLLTLKKSFFESMKRFSGLVRLSLMMVGAIGLGLSGLSATSISVASIDWMSLFEVLCVLTISGLFFYVGITGRRGDLDRIVLSFKTGTVALKLETGGSRL
jgi:hypothetical protein